MRVTTPDHSGLRYGKADTFEEATLCVSDLESVSEELRLLIQVANVSALGRLQKAQQKIDDAVELLMHIDNTDDE